MAQVGFISNPPSFHEEHSYKFNKTAIQKDIISQGK